MILLILKRLGNMPKVSTILKSILVIFLLLSAIVFFLLKVNYVKQLNFQGETVTIQRTQFGIPFIKSLSFKSVIYAWGYVTAEDRLFQLSFKRLIGKGLLSKYLGPKALNVDKMFRELNFKYWAQKTAENMKRQNITQYKHFERYVQGLNDQVKSLKFMPIEFHFIGLDWDQWTVADIFLVSKLLVWSQSQNIAEQYIRSQLLSKYSLQQIEKLLPFKHQDWHYNTLKTIVSDQQLDQQLLKLTIPIEKQDFKPQNINSLLKLGLMQYLDDGRGSNSWVIHGNHTQSGFPLIANDPHLQSAIPHEWHQIRIQYLHNDKYVYLQGVSMTGIPCIVGKSSYASIALTTLYADTQDLFKQTILEDSYLLDGQLIKLNQRKQIIQIKGQTSLDYLIKQTHRGPIISSISHSGKLYQLKQDSNISLVWSGFHDEYQTWAAYSHAAQIDNLKDLKYMLDRYTDYGPNMNALYSTKDNHIGYVAIGSVPVRRNPESGNFVKDGSTTKNDWIALIQQKAKLSLHDPIKGYIVTANNKPVSSKYQNGIYETSAYTARANRIDQIIVESINKGVKLSIEDMKRMQLDTVDALCQQTLPYLLRAVSHANQYIENFDCDLKKQSYEATIYESFFYELYLLISPLKDKQFNLLISHSYLSYVHKYIRQYQNHENSINLKSAFQNTLASLNMFFSTKDSTKWIWGQYHDDVIVHRPFSNSDVLKTFYEKRFPARGNINTINVAKMNKISYGDFNVYHRANIRQIFSHHQQSFWIGDTGISQKFYSKHYDDQYKLFQKDQYIQIDFPKFNSLKRSDKQQL